MRVRTRKCLEGCVPMVDSQLLITPQHTSQFRGNLRRGWCWPRQYSRHRPLSYIVKPYNPRLLLDLRLYSPGNHFKIDKTTIGIGMDEPHFNAMTNLETSDLSPYLSFDRKITYTNPHTFVRGTCNKSWKDVPDAV